MLEKQSTPTKKTEVISIASCSPLQTASQENKLVCKLKLNLEYWSDTSSYFKEKKYGNGKHFLIENNDECVIKSGEPADNFFIKNEYDNKQKKLKTPVNPPEFLNGLANRIEPKMDWYESISMDMRFGGKKTGC